jgi:hypothetical protein
VEHGTSRVFTVRVCRDNTTMHPPLLAALAVSPLVALTALPVLAQDTTTMPPPEPPGSTPPAPEVVLPQSDTYREKDTTHPIEEGGPGLEWVYLNADVGAAYTNLVSLRSSNLQLVDTTSWGAAFGMGAGVRLAFFSVGVRVRDLQMSSFNMWETDLEAAFHFRVWRIDGAIGARGGYAFLGQLSASSFTSTSPSNVDAHGWNVGPTIDLDFYVSKLLSLGIDANGEFLFLERPPVALPGGEAVSPAFAGLYKDSGSSAGVGLLAMSHVGVHF